MDSYGCICIYYNMVYVMRFVVLFVTNKKINRRISHSDKKTGKRQRFTYKSESEGRTVKIMRRVCAAWYVLPGSCMV